MLPVNNPLLAIGMFNAIHWHHQWQSNYMHDDNCIWTVESYYSCFVTALMHHVMVIIANKVIVGLLAFQTTNEPEVLNWYRGERP